MEHSIYAVSSVDTCNASLLVALHWHDRPSGTPIAGW